MRSEFSQSRALRAKLLEAMTVGEYSQCEHLPPESELSEKLGISRTQLRDILAGLDREGYITRRHGVGTIINRHVLEAKNRVDIEVEFLDMIRRSGFTPGTAYVVPTEEAASEAIAHQLNIAVGAPVVRIARLCTANGKPAIYCEDVFPKALLRVPYTKEDLLLPVFHILQDICEVFPYMDLTDVRAAAADEKLAGIFGVPVGAPLLNMEEVDYDIDGKPVFVSSEYFADGIFHHTVMRKKF